MGDVYEDAAALAEIPEDKREIVIAQVRKQGHSKVVEELAELMHDTLMCEIRADKLT